MIAQRRGKVKGDLFFSGLSDIMDSGGAAGCTEKWRAFSTHFQNV
jgi:hypothetical protein